MMNDLISFKLVPPPALLKHDVECFRIAEYRGKEALSIKVCMNGLPGIVFQHHKGRSPVESISTDSGNKDSIPTLYIYGQTTEAGTLNHKNEPYSMMQVILKPHALNSLLGINASLLTNDLLAFDEFSDENINEQLLEAHDEQEQLCILSKFLLKQLKRNNPRDRLIEESLRLIHANRSSIRVSSLLESLNISERQFERRFNQVVGVSPKFYIGVRRFNEALRLMKSRELASLTEIAYALNFYDQSHFIRAIKEFSGSPPKMLFHQIENFYRDQAGYFQL